MPFRLGLDSQSIFGMPPVEHILLAARTGCNFVSLGYGPVPWRLERFADWSLRNDPQLRSDVRSALADHEIGVELAEGFVVRAGVEMAEREADLDLFASLGASKVGAVCMDPDAGRGFEQIALLCEMSRERGLDVMFEYAPPHTFNSLERVCSMIERVGVSNLALLVDSMHFYRCGGTPADLSSLTTRIGYLQLSDTPATQLDDKDYYREACFNRLVPGTGELDLEGLLQAVPDDIPIGLEVPMLANLDDGEALEDIIERMVHQSRELVARHRA